MSGQSANRLNHLGNGITDLVQLTRIDRHLIAGLMHLNSCAIELVLKRWLAEFAYRIYYVVSTPCEHRLNGSEELQIELRKTPFSVFEHRFRNGRKTACH